MTSSLVQPLTVANIAGYFSRSAFEKGRQICQTRRVTSLACDPGSAGDVLTARVLGDSWNTYDVEIFLNDDPVTGGLQMEGECSCPMAFNCKHVAATLFAAIDGKFDVQAELPLVVDADGTPRERQRPLSAGLASWLEKLAQIDESEGEEYPANIADRLVYILDVRHILKEMAGITVSPVLTRLLKDGGLSVTTRPYNPASALETPPARFLRPSDLAILPRLSGGYGSLGRVLSGRDGADILEAVLATGRARWKSVAGPAISRGAVRQARIAWRLDPDATQHVCLEAGDPGSVEVVKLAPPWYVDAEAGVAGPLETGLGARLAEALLSSPPISEEDGATLRREMETRLPGLAPFRPPELPMKQEFKGAPVPRLTLGTGVYRDYTMRMAEPSRRVPAGRISFLYGPVEVAEDDPRARPSVVHDDGIMKVTRDRGAERAASRALRETGLQLLSKLSTYGLYSGERDGFGFRDQGAWLDFLTRSVPKLKAAGWEVVTDPSFPITLAEADSLDAELREGSGIDWFELDLGVLVGDERIEITQQLLALIREPGFAPERLHEPVEEGTRVYLSLDDGRTLAVPTERLRTIMSALYELYAAGLAGPDDARVRFSRFDAGELARAEEAMGVAYRGADQLRQLGAMLRETGAIPHIEPPPWFAANLRPYQAAGVDWLQFLREGGFGAILADDMGLGKTVQVLAHLAIEKERGRLDDPALVVVPRSVLQNWREEAHRFAPRLSVLVLHGRDRAGRFEEIEDHDVVLTTYQLLTRDREHLAARDWHVVVLDEAQVVKNPESITARAARELKAVQRICLTGTPIENHLGELWSQFAFSSPGFLGERTRFNKIWRRPIEAEGDEERRRLLAQRIRPFLLRRAKGEVAAELPPKTEIIEHVEMDGAQRDLYESIRIAMHGRVREAIAAKGLARSHIILLDALLKLRQVCCHPALLKLETAKAARARSAKFDRLIEMLPALIEDGRHILLFSQFTSMLALIGEALDEAEIPYLLLQGDTTDRETPIRRFQAGEVPLFLISLKAGGVGLNLTAADTVIHYDPWWNPAIEEQATDRAHRIGQEKPVFVYRFITQGSIEEKLETLKANKRELAAGILDSGGGSPLSLTEADVEALLAAAAAT